MRWEFYHVISGGGVVRHHGGKIEIEPGDAFLFKPNEPHQIINDRAKETFLDPSKPLRSKQQSC